MEQAFLLCQNIYKSANKQRLLKGVSLAAPSGAAVGIFAPENDSRRALAQILSGVLTPDEGTLTLDGAEVGCACVAYAPGHCALPRHLCTDALVQLYDRTFEGFDAARATALFTALGLNTKRPLYRLSRGTARIVQTILTACRSAKLYLFESPIAKGNAAQSALLLDVIFGVCNQDSLLCILSGSPTLYEGRLKESYLLTDGVLVPREKAVEDGEPAAADRRSLS